MPIANNKTSSMTFKQKKKLYIYGIQANEQTAHLIVSDQRCKAPEEFIIISSVFPLINLSMTHNSRKDYIAFQRRIDYNVKILR